MNGRQGASHDVHVDLDFLGIITKVHCFRYKTAQRGSEICAYLNWNSARLDLILICVDAITSFFDPIPSYEDHAVIVPTLCSSQYPVETATSPPLSLTVKMRPHCPATAASALFCADNKTFLASTMIDLTLKVDLVNSFAVEVLRHQGEILDR